MLHLRGSGLISLISLELIGISSLRVVFSLNLERGPFLGFMDGRVSSEKRYGLRLAGHR